jgi:hypothetical protein
MYERIVEEAAESDLSLARQSRQENRAQLLREGALVGIREMPGLPLRIGRHLTTWLVWHTTRVSLLSDSPTDGFERSGDHAF